MIRLFESSKTADNICYDDDRGAFVPLRQFLTFQTAAVYAVGHKQLARLFCTITRTFIGGFYTSYINGKRNACCIEKLQNITLTVFSLTVPDKTKTHKTAHFEVNCHSILLLNSKNESVR